MIKTSSTAATRSVTRVLSTVSAETHPKKRRTEGPAPPDSPLQIACFPLQCRAAASAASAARGAIVGSKHTASRPLAAGAAALHCRAGRPQDDRYVGRANRHDTQCEPARRAGELAKHTCEPAIRPGERRLPRERCRMDVDVYPRRHQPMVSFRSARPPTGVRPSAAGPYESASGCFPGYRRGVACRAQPRWAEPPSSANLTATSAPSPVSTALPAHSAATRLRPDRPRSPYAASPEADPLAPRRCSTLRGASRSGGTWW